MEINVSTPAIPLQNGMVLQFEAIDPTTSAAVSGVAVSEIAIWASNPGGDTAATLTPVAPLWVPIPNDEIA